MEFSCFYFPAHMSSTRYASAYPEGQSAFWKGSKLGTSLSFSLSHDLELQSENIPDANVHTVKGQKDTKFSKILRSKVCHLV